MPRPPAVPLGSAPPRPIRRPFYRPLSSASQDFLALAIDEIELGGSPMDHARVIIPLALAQVVAAADVAAALYPHFRRGCPPDVRQLADHWDRRKAFSVWKSPALGNVPFAKVASVAAVLDAVGSMETFVNALFKSFEIAPAPVAAPATEETAPAPSPANKPSPPLAKAPAPPLTKKPASSPPKKRATRSKALSQQMA
ncbi:hypothetical protein [Limnoglobus roseus]|uniref:Uncharacterized protein n=1 Tax=Limnoglobus roseus TaxID=2598579 RepID=A0A5C1AWE5_9BACT|nr:hypothetical protein [Limnoglobus roseus]QEL21108.1 hypothetical protein PX52LOC_08238 [Limnoglobus roseus]